MERETGYYWVSRGKDVNFKDNPYFIAIYIAPFKIWRLCGDSNDYADCYFDRIKEKKLKP